MYSNKNVTCANQGPRLGDHAQHFAAICADSSEDALNDHLRHIDVALLELLVIIALMLGINLQLKLILLADVFTIIDQRKNIIALGKLAEKTVGRRAQ
jgi:hypothetical protein